MALEHPYSMNFFSPVLTLPPMDKTQSNSKQSKLGMSLQATTPTTNSPPFLEANSKIYH